MFWGTQLFQIFPPKGDDCSRGGGDYNPEGAIIQRHMVTLFTVLLLAYTYVLNSMSFGKVSTKSESE